jgi:ribonuclease R
MPELPARVRAAYDRLLAVHGVSTDYPPAVEAEVAALVRASGTDDPRLADLTGLPFVTIDGPGARDLDQALHITRGRAGRGYVVRYALADAAWFVRPGSALFVEALRRGTSYYLPGFAVPMLPRALSEGIVSLGPGVVRRALVFVMRLDDDGRSHGTRLVRARIRSRAQLTYEAVEELHEAPARSPLAAQPFTETLLLLREVGERRRALARARNVVDYDREGADIRVSPDEDGTWTFVRAPRDAASRWNEQVSLLCNSEGGRFLVAGRTPRIQPVFRVHDPPGAAALRSLERVVRGALAAHGLDAERLGWRRRGPGGAPGEPLAEFLVRLRASGADGGLVAAIERQALVINQRASYAAQPGAHYAIGVRPYARFSAPMREIVGIFTHKEALEELGLEPDAGPAVDEPLREAVIAAANRARDVQRALEKGVERLALDDRFVGEAALPRERRPEHHGTVLGLAPTRLYLRLADPPLELKVYTEDVARSAGGPVRLTPDEVALARADGGPRFALGDAALVRCEGFDPARDRWRFSLRPA